MRHVADWEADEAFDYISLISANRFGGDLVSQLRLYLQPGRGPLADYLGNPLGFCIMSERMRGVVSDLIEPDSQCLRAPLFTSEGEALDDYWIINPLKVVDCVDFARSIVSRDGAGRIRHLNDPFFEVERIPRNAHLFHVLGPNRTVDTRLYVSQQFGEHLAGKGFTGVMLERVSS